MSLTMYLTAGSYQTGHQHAAMSSSNLQPTNEAVRTEWVTMREKMLCYACLEDWFTVKDAADCSLWSVQLNLAIAARNEKLSRITWDFTETWASVEIGFESLWRWWCCCYTGWWSSYTETLTHRAILLLQLGQFLKRIQIRSAAYFTTSSHSVCFITFLRKIWHRLNYCLTTVSELEGWRVCGWTRNRLAVTYEMQKICNFVVAANLEGMG